MTTTTQRTKRSPKISLFHVEASRSERVVWTATELQIACDVVSPAAPARCGEFQAAHPLTKVLAITVPQGSLFESLAICNWLADSHPGRTLGWPVGTWERALHDQWASFTLAELEANLWHTARNKFVYPERRKVPQVYEQNADEARRALAALDGHLEGRDWLVGAPVLYVSDRKTDQYFATGGARKSNL